jgi:hypothetical protein
VCVSETYGVDFPVQQPKAHEKSVVYFVFLVTNSVAVTRGLATSQLSVNGILPDQAGEI